VVLGVGLRVVAGEEGEEGGFARTWWKGTVVRWGLLRGEKRRITVGALEVPSFTLPDFPVDVFEDLTSTC